MTPIRDQLVAHVAAVVGAARSVQGLDEGVRKFRNPYLPPFKVQVATDKSGSDPEQGHVDIAVHSGRR
jgi:hypothetical protein